MRGAESPRLQPSQNLGYIHHVTAVVLQATLSLRRLAPRGCRHSKFCEVLSESEVISERETAVRRITLPLLPRHSTAPRVFATVLARKLHRSSSQCQIVDHCRVVSTPPNSATAQRIVIRWSNGTFSDAHALTCVKAGLARARLGYGTERGIHPIRLREAP